MTNILLMKNRLVLLVIFVLGVLLISYQIAVLVDNGFFYLIGTGICLYCLNRFLLQFSYVRIPPTLLVPFLFIVFVFLQAFLFLLLPDGTKIWSMGWVFVTVIIGLFLTIRGFVFVIERYRAEANKFA